MNLSLGGLGIMSLRNPFADIVAIILGKGDFRSIFCLIVFSIVLLVLAYLTNPSENSFRAYLTEQSFRQHLSRLDDNADDNHSTNRFRSRYSTKNSTTSTAPPFAMANSPPFHFANRASISLRTPKHVFHSFAIFTIAAMVPLSKASERSNRDCWIISDSWYIGAFGKWWRGGVFEEWYQDVIARSKDEESWSSGIVSIERMDMLHDCNGPTFSVKNLPAHLVRGSPPRLRNRERPTSRNHAIHSRSSTPPPLPKSATLPMHTIRKVSLNANRTCDRSSPLQQQPLSQPCITNDPARRVSTGPTRSPSDENSPIIAEVLRQISTANASLLDLHTQLSECQSAASQSRAVLQHEVDAHRDRKRLEDAAKIELKLRTKTLEDSKRGAESLKKEADKKLKAVQLVRDRALQRMDYLDKEIIGLQQDLFKDRNFIASHQLQVPEAEHDITEALEQKRLEIKAAEELVMILNQQSRELEDKVASEKERLRILREKSNNLKQKRVVLLDDFSQHILHHQETWHPSEHPETDQSPTLYMQSAERWDALDGHAYGQAPSVYDEAQLSQDRRIFPIGEVSGLGSIGTTNSTLDDHNSSFQGNSFTPFSDISRSTMIADSNSNRVMLENLGQARTHFAKDIISNGLTSPVDTGSHISRSFQSDSDPYVDRDWRHAASYSSHYQSDGILSSSSSPSLHGRSANSTEDSPFDIHFPSSRDFALEHQSLESPLQLQRSNWMHFKDPDLALPLDFQEVEYPFKTGADKGRPRHWFSGIGKCKIGQGLNPDAKEFNLFHKGPSNGFNGHGSSATYDALNPNGLGSTISTSTSSTSQSLLRAFAPSPAEREVLQRAFGGSTNTSFERLPSLSDVGSIPASPTSAHARPHLPQPPVRDVGGILPAWLQSVPRARKVNFSPWEDEEPQPESKESGARRA